MCSVIDQVVCNDILTQTRVYVKRILLSRFGQSDLAVALQQSNMGNNCESKRTRFVLICSIGIPISS